MISRRDLLIRSTGAGLGAGLLALGTPVPGLWRSASAAAEARADLPILVVIELTGGNDGLNTVVPYADDVYRKSRPTLRIEPDKALKLGGDLGLHPALADLHAVWESGELAVIEGVGYPNPNRSHFRSMEIWHTGVVGPTPPAGWLGQAADLTPAFGLCHVGPQSVPLAIAGRKAVPQALASVMDYQLAPGARLAEPADADGPDPGVLGQVRRQFATARELAARLAAIPADRAREESVAALAQTLEGRLETIRRLIEAELPLRVYYTSQTGFDTHAGQRYTHQDLLRQVSRGVGAFLRRLKASRLDDRVVVLMFSEFGRRLKENASGGTDHGASAPVLLAGKRVKGGLVGPAPNLSDLDEGGDPRSTTDFRDVYAAVLRRWLDIDPEPILGRREAALALFETR